MQHAPRHPLRDRGPVEARDSELRDRDDAVLPRGERRRGTSSRGGAARRFPVGTVCGCTPLSRHSSVVNVINTNSLQNVHQKCPKPPLRPPTAPIARVTRPKRDPERLGVGHERSQPSSKSAERPAVLAPLRRDLPRADHVLAARPRPAPARARSSTPSTLAEPGGMQAKPDGQSSAAHTKRGIGRRGRPDVQASAVVERPREDAAGRPDAKRAARRSRWETRARRDRARRSARTLPAPHRARAATAARRSACRGGPRRRRRRR